MKSKVVYEVIRIINKKPLFLESHIKRMENSFKLINMEFPMEYEKIKKKIFDKIDAENLDNENIKLTYDVSEKKLDIFKIDHYYPSDDMYKNGVKTILYFGERENPNAKIINQNFRDKVTKEIEKNNAFEAVLIDRNGYITEGSKSNMFMIKGEKILTSPVKAVLPGVTRDEIIKAVKKAGLNVKEVEYSYKDIEKLDAMFISGTSPKVLPINELGDKKFDVNNSVLRKVIKAYDNAINTYLSNN
ncbi:aminotransferase class IV [Clostridium sp. BJN0001]|uniref:aminotransferase class IV n=1 Tax=Clostridium sp. BJN0001 TaxID=2930219 RepID=UPI001FD3C17A|nr:aminotransferase class IV [Clostridium sp. BJN0001]